MQILFNRLHEFDDDGTTPSPIVGCLPWVLLASLLFWGLIIAAIFYWRTS